MRSLRNGARTGFPLVACRTPATLPLASGGPRRAFRPSHPGSPVLSRFRCPGPDHSRPPAPHRPYAVPLPVTPNPQEYPSGHGGLSGAAGRVLADIFGDKTRFTHRTDTAPFAPRTPRSFSAAADEANNSRVYGGIPFRSAVRDGRKIGDS